MNSHGNFTSFLTHVKKYDTMDEQTLSKLLLEHKIHINTMPESNKDDEDEPILQEERKFTVLPIKYKAVWDMYKTQLACFWKPEEIDITKDKEDFEKLPEPQQHMLKRVLAFFAASDGIVNFNLEERFVREIKNTEIIITYDFQKMMENIHGETYSLMLDNLIDSKDEREHLFNAIKTIPSVKKMSDWAFKWIESDLPFSYRVIAFSIVEGVFFSGAFALIFWFKSSSKGKQILNGLISSNEFIARDEGLHTNFACLIYKDLIKKKLPESEIYKIFDEAVEIACEFNNDALSTPLLGLDCNKMNEYTKYVADRLIMSLGCGYSKRYKVNNPLKYMETIGLLNKTNFFEDRPTEYQDSKVKNVKNNRTSNTKKKLSKLDDF
jgi:ribonucleoside-diphosphate reductase beta chain